MAHRLVLVSSGVLVSLACLALMVADDHGDHSGTAIGSTMLIGWAFVGSGIVALRARSGNAVGPALLFIGFAWFATTLDSSDNALLFTIGTWLEALYVAGFVYLLLVFPHGYLRSILDRAIATAALVLATLVELAWMLFAESSEFMCARCPDNVLQVRRDDSLAGWILGIQRGSALLLMLTAIALLARRFVTASVPERRALFPVLVTGAATLMAFGLSLVADLATGSHSHLLEWTWLLCFALVPVAFVAALVRARLARAAVADLMLELRSVRTPEDLEGALRRALGDAGVEAWYWMAERGELCRQPRSTGGGCRRPSHDRDRAAGQEGRGDLAQPGGRGRCRLARVGVRSGCVQSGESSDGSSSTPAATSISQAPSTLVVPRECSASARGSGGARETSGDREATAFPGLSDDGSSVRVRH